MAKKQKRMPSCCPVIKLKCRMTKPRKVKDSYRDPYTGEKKTITVTTPSRRVCAVALGEKVVTGYFPDARKAGRRINAFRKQLAARNCNVRVDVKESLKGKMEPLTKSDITASAPSSAPASKVEALKGKALRSFNKMLKSMY